MNTTPELNLNKKDISLSNSAIISGIGLLVMAVLAPIANFSILQGLIVSGDAGHTFSNIISSEGEFRLAVVFFLIIVLLDIIVAWGLYVLLKPINKSLSLLTAWLRLVYSAMLGFSIFYLINVLILVSNTQNPVSFDADQIQGLVMLSLSSFKSGWEFGLIVFGFHLLLLGSLILKAGYMHKILGTLLIISSLGYLIDGFGRLISSDYNITISVYTFIGEIVLIFWLLISGRKIR
jgi:diacylglycerol kinase